MPMATALGKENICPSQDGCSREANVLIGESRSPLPEGFLRAPLQDITRIFYPLNLLPEGEAQKKGSEPGGCRPRRKRTKCKGTRLIACSLATCEPDLSASRAGLVQCAAVQAAGKEVQIDGESKLREVMAGSDLREVEQELRIETEAAQQNGIQEGFMGFSSFAEERLSLDIVQKRRRQVVSSSSSTTTGANLRSELKARSSVLKFR